MRAGLFWCRSSPATGLGLLAYVRSARPIEGPPALGVLQSELLDRELFPTPEATNEGLMRFALYYDYHRLNGAIGWQTPAERWAGTPFTDHGFEYVPALEHLQGWVSELMSMSQ